MIASWGGQLVGGTYVDVLCTYWILKKRWPNKSVSWRGELQKGFLHHIDSPRRRRRDF